MPLQERGFTDGGFVFLFGRTHTQRAVDIFKGDTGDRLGDTAFADPRETKLLKLYQNLQTLNRVAGNPLPLPPTADQELDELRAGTSPAATPPAPPAEQTTVLGVKDP